MSARQSSVSPVRLLVVLLMILSGCASRDSQAGSRQLQVPPRPLYAIMGAFGPELAAFENLAVTNGSRFVSTRINGVTFKRGEVAGRDCVLFLSGVSMVNAAMTTQLALDHFPIGVVLFTGIAGGVNPSRSAGDVVIPERWIHHSEAAYLNPRPDGSGYVFPEYFQPGYPNFGFVFPNNVSVVREGMEEPEQVASFEVNSSLLTAAKIVATSPPSLMLRGRPCRIFVGGNGVSGPVFVDNREYRNFLWRTWKAECTEMEGAAVAQACWANRKPCLIVRGLGGLAGGQSGVNAEEQNAEAVSHNAALVTLEILQRLPR